METAITVYESTNVGSYGMVARSTSDSQVIAMWVAQSASAHTRQLYQRVADSFLVNVGKPLQAVTLSDLQTWQGSLVGAINTKRVYVRAVQSLFGFLHKTGYINLNPGVMLRPEKQAETKHQKILSEEMVIRMVTSAQLSTRDEAIVRVLYSSAMRVSELCNLRWCDVIETGNRAILVIRGKGSKTRESGISATAYAAMKRQRTDSEFVFTSNRGRQMDRTTVNYLFTKLSVVVGRDVSPHWLRHSHITHALQRGANPTDVMNQAGHSSLAVTTTYAHSDKFSSDSLVM